MQIESYADEELMPVIEMHQCVLVQQTSGNNDDYDSDLDEDFVRNDREYDAEDDYDFSSEDGGN